MGKYVNLDKLIVVPLVDEAMGDAVCMTEMSVGDMFEKFGIVATDAIEEGVLQKGVKPGLRPCSVDGRPGAFHRWADVARTIPPSPMVGGYPGGQLWSVIGIVELENGKVEEVGPSRIVFEDKSLADERESETKSRE